MKKHVNLIEKISLLSAAVLLFVSIMWGVMILEHSAKASTIPSWMAAIAIIIAIVFIAERFLIETINEAKKLKEKMQEMKENEEILFFKIIYIFLFFGIFPAIVAGLITVATGIIKLPVQEGYFADNLLHTPFSWWEMALVSFAITIVDTILILKNFRRLNLKLNFFCK